MHHYGNQDGRHQDDVMHHHGSDNMCAAAIPMFFILNFFLRSIVTG
jgi:hypothetical protein